MLQNINCCIVVSPMAIDFNWCCALIKKNVCFVLWFEKLPINKGEHLEVLSGVYKTF